MRTDKKIELYQHYKKLENKLIDKNILALFLRGVSIFVWFLMFLMGFITVPYLSRTNFYSSEHFKREICKIDSTQWSSSVGSVPISFFTRVQDTLLPFEQRKAKIVYMYGEFNNFDILRYLDIEIPEFISDINPKIFKAIPLWVHEENGLAYRIEKRPSDKIDFTTDKVLFVVSLLSFPFYYIFIMVLWEKWKKRKIKLQRDVIKAKHQWQNYTTYN